MTKYACYDCDATFDAPTDTETVRCPGCGEMVEQQPAVVSPPTDQAALRDRIAAALYERERPPRDPHWPDAYAMDRETFEAMADAVLSVLGEPTDRAAMERVRAVLETEAVVGRSALEYRGLIVSALMAVEAHGTGTQQPCPGVETVPNRCTCDCEGCKHHCGAHNPAATKQQCPEREPLIGVQCSKQAGHEAHSDRPGRIWYPVADDAAQQQESTDEDVVEAHRLALSEALGLGTGAPWDAIRDRAAELGAQQQPAAEETDEERADREATERDHARGDHTYCGITCETEMPTEHLRNFVIAKGYPGTGGALDELLRRARAEVAEQQAAAADGEETRR